MPAYRISALIHGLYALGFGLPAIPCAHFLLRRGRLPMFFDMFPMYMGPVFQRLSPRGFAGLLYAFAALCAVDVWIALLLWKGLRVGGVLALCVLPVEAAFWWAFSLPIPLLPGAARLVFLAIAWKSLR
jgi:hypothetical protein